MLNKIVGVTLALNISSNLITNLEQYAVRHITLSFQLKRRVINMLMWHLKHNESSAEAYSLQKFCESIKDMLCSIVATEDEEDDEEDKEEVSHIINKKAILLFESAFVLLSELMESIKLSKEYQNIAFKQLDALLISKNGVNHKNKRVSAASIAALASYCQLFGSSLVVHLPKIMKRILEVLKNDTSKFLSLI